MLCKSHFLHRFIFCQKHCRFLPTWTMINRIYYTFIFSHLVLSNPLWCGGSSIHPMERNKPNMRYLLTHNVYHLIHFRSSSQSLVCCMLIEPLPWLHDHCSTSLGVRYEMNINVGSMSSFGNGDIFKSKKHWLGEIYAMTRITKGLFN